MWFLYDTIQVEGLADASSYRTAVDAAVDVRQWAAAVQLCADAHMAAAFRHYTIGTVLGWHPEYALGLLYALGLIYARSWICLPWVLPQDDLFLGHDRKQNM